MYRNLFGGFFTWFGFLNIFWRNIEGKLICRQNTFKIFVFARFVRFKKNAIEIFHIINPTD